MLFKTSDLDSQQKAPEKSGALTVSGEQEGVPMKHLDQVGQGIGRLEEGYTLHFFSKGKWSMHELLSLMLQKAGPSDVLLSTWTITEDPVRSIFLQKQKGLIKSLSCILDYRIKDRKPKPFQLLQSTADRLALTQCHAKVTIVRGRECDLTCISSANYSRNPRLEAGIISASTQIADFHQAWMEEAIKEQSK